MYSTLEKHKSETFELCRQYFGNVDIGNSTIEQELSHVVWEKSWGFFVNRKLKSFLLVAETDINEYLSKNGLCEVEGIHGLKSVRGDALVIDPEYKKESINLFMKLKNYDFVWGTAHEDLENMSFWSKHSVSMPIEGNQSHIFVLSKKSNILQKFKDIFELNQNTMKI